MTVADPTVPALLVGGDRRYDWALGAVIRVGRDAACEVVVDDRHVAPVHFQIEGVDGGWLLRDAGTDVGTWVGGLRVRTLAVEDHTSVAFGPGDGPTLELGLSGPAPATPLVTESAGESRLRAYSSSRGLLRIGRDPGNDVALTDDLRASRQHAQIRGRPDGGWEIRDLGSSHGTFVNGQRVGISALADGDVIAVGSHVFRFTAGSLQEVSVSDEVSLEVAGVGVHKGESQLLHDVTFAVTARSVLAIVGPSGAGKTTMLRALTGFEAPTSGQVRFAGRDLYQSYDEMRSRIGYVPQDDLVHPSLTVGQELSFAASLRLAPDVSSAERQGRVAQVMDELGLTERAGLQVEKLSGGQRKRVSVGTELLTEPALLFLDEPTSGLDPGNEHQVMSVLRDLADGGRIVVVVTHATQSLGMVDRILFLANGGHMAYFGPPDEALKFFARHGVEGGYPAIFHALEAPDAAVWAERFLSDPDHDRFAPELTAPATVPSALAGGARQVAPVKPMRQFDVLCRRQLRILAGDRKTLLTLVAQAPAFGLIVFLLFPGGTLGTGRGPFAALLEWLLVISATWLGTSNTIREIVKEAPIYRRERAVGLSRPAYLASKMTVFGVITLVQTWIVVLIGLANQPIPAADKLHVLPALRQSQFSYLLDGLRGFNAGSLFGSQLFEILVALSLTGLAACAMGLAISALVSRSEQASVVLPVILVLQMAISLPMLRLGNTSKLLSGASYLSSAAWGVNAVGSTTSLNQLMTSYLIALDTGTDQIHYALLGSRYSSAFYSQQLVDAITGFSAWKHAPGAWLLAVFLLVVIAAALLALAMWGLRRNEIGVRR